MPERPPRPRDDVLSLRTLDLRGARPSGIQLGLNEWPEPITADRFLTTDDLRGIALNRYATVPRRLREAIARRWDVRPEEVLVGNGSMDILLDLCLAYGGAGRTALVFAPTYPLYARFALIAGTTVATESVGVPYTLDAGRVRDAIARSHPSVVFFSSPNNPTGNLIDPSAIFAAAEAAPDAVVVVDEAYAEFSGATLLQSRATHANVVFAKTLSKVHAAAGLRIGALIADPRVVETVMLVANAWAVDVISAVVAERILAEPEDLWRRRVAFAVRERERVAAGLSGRDELEVFPSHASFLLVRHRAGAATRLSAALAEQGILVRDVSSWGATDCLRITIGTADENDRLLVAVAHVLDAVPAG